MTIVPDPPVYADYVLDALPGWRAAGLKTALVTLVEISGSSPRPLGSQIAVAEDGRAIGAVTGGCVEQSIVLDAMAAIARRESRLERYGEGSRFKDLKLPCGSGITVHFDVDMADDRLASLLEARAMRQVARYTISADGLSFDKVYEPQRRLVIAGQGNVVPWLAKVAAMTEYQVMVFSPDDNSLNDPGDFDDGLLDAFTAFVSLFHDHSFEPELLDKALASPAFYIGALGSRRAQAARLATLAERGWDAAMLNRIHGPVGLDIGARTPPEIAVSIVAQVVEAARRKTEC
ncbi:MAG: XdhC family protein [Asticcacaulis sp.]|nr:XdhC family protein [Asticcacaulis sp.]